MNYVFFKYLSTQDQIVFLSAEVSESYLSLISKEYCSNVHDLLNKRVTDAQFKSTLTERAFLEFEQVILVMKKVGLIDSTDEIVSSPLAGLTTEVLYSGEYFFVQTEPLNQGVQVSARNMLISSEGLPCDSVGTQYCETATGTSTTELWECISGSPNNWANVGVSC